MIKNDMLRLEVGDITQDEQYKVLRVPGGWLYTDKYHMCCAFVPFPYDNTNIKVDINDNDIEKLRSKNG